MSFDPKQAEHLTKKVGKVLKRAVSVETAFHVAAHFAVRFAILGGLRREIFLEQLGQIFDISVETLAEIAEGSAR